MFPLASLKCIMEQENVSLINSFVAKKFAPKVCASSKIVTWLGHYNALIFSEANYVRRALEISMHLVWYGNQHLLLTMVYF